MRNGNFTSDLVKASRKLKELNGLTAVFLIASPLVLGLTLPQWFSTHTWTWQWTLYLLCFYTLSNLSITVAYHRYFSHRSFEVSEPVQILFLLLSSMALQGSAARWSTDHRRHHRLVDTEQDPYSISRGFFFAHMGWLLFRDLHPEATNIAPDLAKSKWIKIQNDWYLLFAVIMGFGFPGLVAYLLGMGFWSGVLIGGLLRTFLSQHSTFLINSAAHVFGSQPYTDRNSARDNAVMAVLTFGEGYHNFHHYFQADYRNGVRWYQWDPTKWTIRIMAVVGIASRLKRASNDEILKARIAMDAKRLQAKGASSEMIDSLRERILCAQKRWIELSQETARLKSELTRIHSEKSKAIALEVQNWQIKLLEKRAELELARFEVNNAIEAWKMYVRTWRRLQTVPNPTI